jgi:hypothetical protein
MTGFGGYFSGNKKNVQCIKSVFALPEIEDIQRKPGHAVPD